MANPGNPLHPLSDAQRHGLIAAVRDCISLAIGRNAFWHGKQDDEQHGENHKKSRTQAG
jgi:hypothetical protein